MSEITAIQSGKGAARISRGVWPALALVFTAPLVAEFLLGNLPIKMLPALIVLAPMYGGGALLIRECVRRTGRGWPSILLLGMAYALFEEAYTTQSLFNPNYLHLNIGLLAPGYIPALGIGAWWTLWMLNVHAVWSISTPIALIEACVPERARTPWLGRVGMAVVVLVFLFGIVSTTLIGYDQDHYIAFTGQFIDAAVAIVLLVCAAFAIRWGRASERPGSAPSAWLLGAVALVFASAALLVPMTWGWGAVGALLALDVGMLAVALAWEYKGPLQLRHQVAMGAGAALAYGWHAFLQHPAVGGLNASVRVGNVIFLAAALGLIGLAAKRVRRFDSSDVNGY
ncbi:MAG TPA: hypothetical protein VMV57_15035 [Terracidiphilus sp.]|nr:hypothetical protein [Terracidiphilus sp.]